MNYVVGFLFSESLSEVVLIRKQKPKWQAGKLNGVGGKIESGEEPIMAMVREFKEETSVFTDINDWHHFCHMHGRENDDGGRFAVEFYAAKNDTILSCVLSPEEEKVEVVYTRLITPTRSDVVENLPWLVAMAIDCLRDSRPQFALVTYP